MRRVGYGNGEARDWEWIVFQSSQQMTLERFLISKTDEKAFQLRSCCTAVRSSKRLGPIVNLGSRSISVLTEGKAGRGAMRSRSAAHGSAGPAGAARKRGAHPEVVRRSCEEQAVGVGVALLHAQPDLRTGRGSGRAAQ